MLCSGRAARWADTLHCVELALGVRVVSEAPSWLREAVATFGEECRVKLAGPGDREAAIRAPLEALLRTVGDRLEVAAVFHDEVRDAERRVRPDYGVSVDGVISGYVEVKAPGHSVDPSAFRGHDKEQWERQRDLPNLIYTNGTEWRLYRDGELRIGPVVLVGGTLAKAGRRLVAVPELETLLTDFLRWKPAPITSVTALVRAVAPLTRLLRGEVEDQLEAERRAIAGGADEYAQPFTGLARDWRALLFPQADDATFADGYAQTVTFALLLARTEGIELAGARLHQIGDQLGAGHSLMGKALQLLTDDVAADFRVTLDLLVRVVGAVDWERIRAGHEDAYLHLYENFLDAYDPALRRASGSYYTPREVVVEMVRLVDEALRSRLDCPAGFLSPQVLTVDPAMGTGTYLHTVIQRVAEQVSAEEGPGAVPSAVAEVARRLIGFELQMGPYAVAELRASDLVRKHKASLPDQGVRLYVTNTLDDPYQEQAQLATTYAPLSRSRRRANEIKRTTPVTVVLGNPPYKERAEGLGRFIEQGAPNTEWATPPLAAFRLDGNGRLEYVLKNLYVYFWRWATWKVFDAQPDNRHGVITFITTSGYLRGPGFKGMREYLRRTCDEGWIINVSPEGMQPDVSTRVFPGVQQPLAIGLFVRRTATDTNTPARIWYTEVHGRREEKYVQLAKLTLDGAGWRAVRDDWHATFTPVAESDWDDYPALGDLMPWTAPGVKANRGWVYAPSPVILRERWNKLITESDRSAKRELFKETSDRWLDTEVEPLSKDHRHRGTIAQETAQCPDPMRVGYRSFDRQWVIPDRRLIDRPRPELWQVVRSEQVFVNELHSKPIRSGPGLVFSSLIPDMHHFKGSEGGRILPMLHADGAPNVTPRLLSVLSDRLGVRVTAQDFVAYLAGVVAHRGFTERFADELTTPGIRVPLTTETALWAEAVELGRDVVWASTYGDAFADADDGRPRGNIRYAAGDPRRPLNVTAIPALPLPASIEYDHETLRVGDGAFAPVPERVWLYDVDGTPVIRRWFASRKANPGGRVSSPLDKIHVTEWPHDWTVELNDLLTVLRRLVELEPRQAALLDRILASPQMTVTGLTSLGILPVPDKARKARKVVDLFPSDEE